MPEHTDEQVAERVQAGDAALFGILVERYEAKLLRYAKKFLSSPEDAEDTVQEIFIKAYASIQSFNTDKRFSPWIYRIAHNELVNALKKKGREKIFFFDLDALFPHPIAKETADSDAERAEMRRMIDTALETLDAKYREPLVLYYLEEMTYKEIADILRLPVFTVGVRIQRGKTALKKHIRL